MDPLTAIGLASNIIAFVDFSSKLVKVAAEVRRSTSGITEEIGDAVTISESLESMLAGLQTPRVPATAPHEDEKLVLLAKDCSKTCTELQELVQKIKGRPSSSGLGPAWRALRNGGKLAAMETKLEKFRGQILGHVAMMMSHKVSATHTLLERLAESQMTAPATKDLLTKIKDDIMAAIHVEHENAHSQTFTIQELRKSSGALSTKSIKFFQAPTAPAQSPLLEAVREALSTLSTTAADVAADEQILEWLWFPDLYSRESSIGRAHDGTYRWILHPEPFDASSSSFFAETTEADVISTVPSFDDTDDFKEWRQEEDARLLRVEQELRSNTRQDFTRWLEHDNGLFYISGKPGSGKSTLMKYIAGEEETVNLLNSWAADNKLILARFFFWRTGSDLQRSSQGLYRSILWEILRQCPGSGEHLFPSFWRDTRRGDVSTKPTHRPPPELHELEAAFDILAKNPNILQQAKVCIFVDGLDEYEGDYWKLGTALIQACRTANIKICAASRHYNEFQRLFVDGGDAHTWIQIHDLTRGDMTRFVTDELEGDERFKTIRHTSQEYDEIVSDVVDRAEGVFLWTRLVVQQLLKDLGNQCSTTQLRRRLVDLPVGLDSLFRQMLDRIDLVERRRLARTVLSVLAGARVHRVAPGAWMYTHWVIDNLDDDPHLGNSILEGTIGPSMTREEILQVCSQTKQRLLARGQGLLVTQSNAFATKPDTQIEVVQFTHRSVIDFLTSPDILRELKKLAGDFSPHKVIALGILSALKHFPPDAIDTRTDLSSPEPTTFYTISQGLLDDLGLHETDMVRLICTIDRERMVAAPHSPPLLPEMASLCRLLKQQASRSKQGTVALSSPISPLTPFFSRLRALEDVESAVTCLAITNASPQLARKMFEWGVNGWSEVNLLFASARDLIAEESWISSITRGVFAQNPDPNKPATRIDRSQPNLTEGYREYFHVPAPHLATWTAWTTILHVYHQITCYDSVVSGGNKMEVSKYFEAYLSSAADPSVCFVGFPFSDADFSLKPPCYIDLATMLNLWRVPAPIGVLGEGGWFSSKSNWWPRRMFPKKGASGSLKPQRVGFEGINLDYFWLVAVVPLEKLEDVPYSEVSRVWEQRRPSVLRDWESKQLALPFTIRNWLISVSFASYKEGAFKREMEEYQAGLATSA